MVTKSLSVALAFSVVLFACSVAVGQPQTPQEDGLTRDEKILALVKQLAADSRTFRKARSELGQIGKPALSQLVSAEAEAEKNGNRVLARRIRSVVKYIETAGEPRVEVNFAKGRGGIVIRRGLVIQRVQWNVRKPILSNTAPPADAVSLDLLANLGVRLGEGADGLRVVEVKRGMPAEQAGIKAGDIIATVNGRTLSTLEEARSALANAELGKPLHMEITRQGTAIELTVYPR